MRQVSWRRVSVAAAAVLMVGCGAGTGSTAGNPTPSAFTSTKPSVAADSAPPASAVATVAPSSSALSASLAVTGLTGHIVFTRAGDPYGDETVFAVKTDGSYEKQLTDFGRGGGPWATRDGHRIAVFTVNAEHRGTVTIENIDGTDANVLPLPPGTLNLGNGPFSPDGKRLLREGFDDNHPEVSGIYFSNVDGSAVTRLTERHFIPGDWSPDGQQLLLFGNDDESSEPPPPGSLYVARADGSDAHQLTPAGAEVQCCFGYHYSPDGTKVLFASPDGGLWTISPDGSDLKEVFHDPKGNWAITPSWSPDGSMIVFALDPTANPFAHPHNGLYVVRSDGTGVTLLLGGDNFKREPVWVAP